MSNSNCSSFQCSLLLDTGTWQSGSPTTGGWARTWYSRALTAGTTCPPSGTSPAAGRTASPVSRVSHTGRYIIVLTLEWYVLLSLFLWFLISNVSVFNADGYTTCKFLVPSNLTITAPRDRGNRLRNYDLNVTRFPWKKSQSSYQL